MITINRDSKFYVEQLPLIILFGGLGLLLASSIIFSMITRTPVPARKDNITCQCK